MLTMLIRISSVYAYVLQYVFVSLMLFFHFRYAVCVGETLLRTNSYV